MNSPDHDCATQVMYSLPSAEAARALRELLPERDRRQDRPPHLHRVGPGADGRRRRHPAMNPFNMPANAECRKPTRRICARSSLEILDRTVMVATHPDHTAAGHRGHLHNIGVAARVALDAIPTERLISARPAGRRPEIRSQARGLKLFIWIGVR